MQAKKIFVEPTLEEEFSLASGTLQAPPCLVSGRNTCT